MFRFRAVLTTLLKSQTNYPVLMRREKGPRLSHNAYEKEEILCNEEYTGEDWLFYGTGNYVCHIALRREAYRDGKGNN